MRQKIATKNATRGISDATNCVGMELGDADRLPTSLTYGLDILAPILNCAFGFSRSSGSLQIQMRDWGLPDGDESILCSNNECIEFLKPEKDSQSSY